MAEVTETKNGDVIVFCDCGLVHTISPDNNGELEVTTKFKKENKSGKDKTDKTDKEEKRTSVFKLGTKKD
jgi:hypothetical protein